MRLAGRGLDALAWAEHAAWQHQAAVHGRRRERPPREVLDPLGFLGEETLGRLRCASGIFAPAATLG